MKKAIVSLATGKEWEELGKVTFPSQIAYANKIGANHKTITTQNSEHPHYDKWQLLDLFGEYDRLLYMDVDIIIRPDCPDMFDLVPENTVGGHDEIPFSPWVNEEIKKFCALANIPLCKPGDNFQCPYYLNAGLFIVSRCHKSLFRDGDKVQKGIEWPEQTHFNVRILQDKVPVTILDPKFNWLYQRTGNYLDKNYVLHYAACGPPLQRIKLVQKDLQAWKLKYKG
jgi:lipopolysaccharide biosynthesis glycosyltransferase